MIKTTLLSLSLWLFAIATTLAQTADVIYLFDGRVVLGDIKKALYPLREAKIDINTESGSQTYFLDQIDSVRENGVMYKKLSYRLGRETFQSLGKPYFKGDWILYETDLWKTVEVHIMEVDGRTLVLTEPNYWSTFRNYIDPDYETRPIKYFDPVFLSEFSVKYHEAKGKAVTEAIVQEKRLSDVRFGFGLGFMGSDFGSSAPLAAESTSAFSLNLLIALNRFQFETYYRFNKMPINARVNTNTINFDVQKNEFALLTKYMIAPDKLVQPNIQAGLLLMGAKVVGDISAPANLQTGVTSFEYDAPISTFLGAGLYFNLKPVGFAINYRRTSPKTTVFLNSIQTQEEQKMNTISLDFYF